MNFEGNKTVKSYFSCSLSSLLGFWVVLELFWGFLDLLPLTALEANPPFKSERGGGDTPK